MTRAEIADIITHATMYVGWPKGWAVLNLAKEVWGVGSGGLGSGGFGGVRELADVRGGRA